jgi:hypothetical protein
VNASGCLCRCWKQHRASLPLKLSRVPKARGISVEPCVRSCARGDAPVGSCCSPEIDEQPLLLVALGSFWRRWHCSTAADNRKASGTTLS